VDGTNNCHGTITHACDLIVKQGNRKEQQCFYVLNLGKDRFILGYPWFRAFAPDIDWTNAQLRGPQIKMETLKLETFQKLKEYKNKLLECITIARMQCTPRLGVTPEMGGLAEIKRMHNAIEMAHKYATEHGKEEVTLPVTILGPYSNFPPFYFALSVTRPSLVPSRAARTVTKSPDKSPDRPHD